MRLGKGSGYVLLLLFLATGAVIGAMLTEALQGPFNGSGWQVLLKPFTILDVQPITLNLGMIKISFGISFLPNFISLASMLLAAFLFYKF